MQKIVRKLRAATSIRLNTLVVAGIMMLLGVSLGVLFFFTRKALVEEAKMDAEQRLEATVQHVDNILMTIEQTSGNIYYRLIDYIDQPERMPYFCRRLVESNPNIGGCAIAFTARSTIHRNSSPLTGRSISPIPVRHGSPRLCAQDRQPGLTPDRTSRED